MSETGAEPPPPSPDGQAAPATPAIRIGTAERNAALKALDAHLEAGRLDAVEYGDRSAHVAEARTVDDIRPLFADLPPPHPDLPGPAGSVPERGDVATRSTRSTGTPATRERGALEVWGPRVAGVMPLVAVALFFLVGGPNAWAFFLLIPAAGMLFRGSRHGDDHHDEEHRRRHEERRDRRDERRERRDRY